MQVPGFLARQFYVKGSLRNTEGGFQLEAHNPMGQGTLVGVGRIAVDGQTIEPGLVRAVRAGETEPIHAAEVSRERPIRVDKGDRVTLHISAAPLSPGDHRLDVELEEAGIGRLSFSVKDRLAT
jgi:hypothetical protein